MTGRLIYINNLYDNKKTMKIELLLSGIFTTTTFYKPLNTYFKSFEFEIQNSFNSDFVLTYDNVYNLALMSYNVYFDNKDKWYDVNLNKSTDISLDKSSVKSYLYSNDDKSINVIVFKGTSVILSGEPSVPSDKFNDNLFFSCCFYKESNLFTLDHCKSDYKGDYKCNQLCYKESINFSNNYYNISQGIIDKLKEYIPLSSIYAITGHSLGGALATMMGIRYDIPVVTFESPGEKHYMKHISENKDIYNYKSIYHFGHNADIIFTGECKGRTSLCYLGGYNIETKCHIGKICEYDTKKYLQIKPSIFYHKLQFVIESVITKWNNTLPECIEVTNCTDCDEWSYF